MNNKVLVFAVVLLASCQAENEKPRANLDAPASSETAVYHVRSQQNIKFQPVAVTNPQPVQTAAKSIPVKNNQKTIYQCKLPDGNTLFSDKVCDNVEQTIPLVEFKSRKIAPVPAYTSNPATYSTASTQTNSSYQKPSAYEINKRYDNLARKLNAIFDRKDKAQLSQALLMLERDRNHALSMRAEIKQTHDINKRYDNMAREASFRNKSKALAYQLLKIEQMRNHELYRDNVTF